MWRFMDNMWRFMDNMWNFQYQIRKNSLHHDLEQQLKEAEIADNLIEK